MQGVCDPRRDAGRSESPGGQCPDPQPPAFRTGHEEHRRRQARADREAPGDVAPGGAPDDGGLARRRRQGGRGAPVPHATVDSSHAESHRRGPFRQAAARGHVHEVVPPGRVLPPGRLARSAARRLRRHHRPGVSLHRLATVPRRSRQAGPGAYEQPGTSGCGTRRHFARLHRVREWRTRRGPGLHGAVAGDRHPHRVERRQRHRHHDRRPHGDLEVPRRAAGGRRGPALRDGGRRHRRHWRR